MTDSTNSTPKRKRGMETTLTPLNFSFDPTRSAEDGSDSPRSKVAHKFRGLALEGESGGGVATGDEDADVTESAMRKRQRPDEVMSDVPEAVGVADSDGKTVPQPELAQENREAEVSGKLSEGSNQPEKPPISRRPEAKAKGRRKRTGTPPPRLRKKAPDASGEDDGDEEMEIVEPVRAALTWHEDEITIYDPDDADDDGTGINGVGFRPTPALAHARLMRRRQQMAEYRKREENEARARRSQRRNGQNNMAPSSDESSQSQPQPRRVRFTEESNHSYVAANL